MEKHPAPQLGTNGDVIGARILAFLLDGVIVTLIWGAAFLIGAVLGDAGLLVLLLVATVAVLVYGFLLEGLYGYTPGKYLLGLVVVKSDGTNCTVGSSFLRNLLWFVDGLFLSLVGMALILLTDDNQRAGDLVADTVVVKRR